MSRIPALLRVYSGLTRMGEPLIRAYLKQRLRRGKEDGARLSERRGLASLLRPSGRLVWIHAASVGETLTVLPLVRALTERGTSVLLTTVTTTSAKLAQERLGERAYHQYAPVDVPRFIDRFLDHWRPDMVLFAEQELWPNMLMRTKARGIPMVLVNARMSPRSYQGWSKAPKLAASLLGQFDLCLAQSQGDAHRLENLGAGRVSTAGNLKFDAPLLPFNDTELSHLQRQIGGRAAWAAASTHEGEEALVAGIHRALKGRMPGLLTILAPRHPQRGDEVTKLLMKAGLTVARRSLKQWPLASTDVFLIDTIGDMGLVYRAVNLAFMGGSLVPHGGQNPIEAARLVTGIVHGSHVHNFAEVYDMLDTDGGGIAVANGQALGEQVFSLLRDAGRANFLSQNAGKSVALIGGALATTLAALDHYFIQMTIEER